MSQLDDDSLDQEPLSSSPEYSGEESDLSMTADAFAHGCDSVSISSFTSDRLKPGQEDTASLVSTATLVPECIYIPPVGYQLLSEQEFMQQKLTLQNVSEQLEKVTNEKDALQEALRCSSEDCSNRVMLLMDQIKNSEELLQNLQKTLVDSQQKTTCQMGSLLASFGRLCKDVSSLNEENDKLRALSCTGSPNEQRQAASHTPLQREAHHRQERLCIEIVTLQEELNASLGEKSDLEEQLKRERETHTEDREIMEGKYHNIILLGLKNVKPLLRTYS
ncbi:rab GTPase-binding effector protein 2 isoform X2 [Bombina bombina]|nr:rab GTPase-binding effector protein 2 isoform X2 [Bombina bombina]